VNTRLSLLYNLQKKHRVNSNAELLAIQEDLSDKIQKAVFGDEAVEKLQKQLMPTKPNWKSWHCSINYLLTAKAIPAIEKSIGNLAEMGMGNSALRLSSRRLADFWGLPGPNHPLPVFGQ
jgi:DNA repair protein RecN (Recombination protein N)